MKFLVIQLLVNGFVTGSFYALAGVSWGIIYRTTRIFHFSHHLVFAISGYTAVLVTTQFHLPYIFGFLAAIAVAPVLGCSIDAFLYRRLRMVGATQATTFLASLGLGTAGVAFLLLVFSSDPRSLGKGPAKALSIGPANFTSDDLIMAVGSWIMIGLLLLFLAKSRYGKAIRAVGSNSEMAKNLGLNIDKLYLLVFGIGSVLFGGASFLYTAKNVAVPTMGLPTFFMSFTAVFLGA